MENKVRVCIATPVHNTKGRTGPGAFVISDLPRDQYDVDFTVAAQPRPTGIPGFWRSRRQRHAITFLYV